LIRETLSQQSGENCLDALRAHLRDLEAGEATIRDMKLLILGNGRAGKTQLRRKLCGNTFQPDSDSTHGVEIDTTLLPDGAGGKPSMLHIWDLGGQDLYHGTHALFVRSRALFLLVWATDTENADTYEYGGIEFRNHRLPYWMDYVRHLCDGPGPVLIVQTKCDMAPGERRAPATDAELQALRYPPELRVSARPPTSGFAGLTEALQKASNELRSLHGSATIGIVRLRIQRRLEAMRTEDNPRPVAERRHRTRHRFLSGWPI
jgi:internalin A